MTQVVERTHLAEDVRTKALAAALDYVRTTARPVPGLDSANRITSDTDYSAPHLRGCPGAATVRSLQWPRHGISRSRTRG